MRKIITLLMIVIMCFSMTACGSGNKKAFEASKAAYDNIDIAYEISERFGEDIYEAWRLGIYDKDEVLDDGVKYLAKKLSLSEEEITEGIVYTMFSLVHDKDYETASEEDKEELRESEGFFFTLMEDSLFSACVMVVTGAYIANGEAEKAEVALEEAKSYMKELSEKYSDYEHYPNLKEYYTTTSSLFNFCQNPTGSFEQVKETINDYRNDARDYIADLDYIFEE